MNRQEALLTGGGEETGAGGAEGLSATGDGGQAAPSFTPATDGLDPGSLMDSILPSVLTK